MPTFRFLTTPDDGHKVRNPETGEPLKEGDEFEATELWANQHGTHRARGWFEEVVEPETAPVPASKPKRKKGGK